MRKIPKKLILIFLMLMAMLAGWTLGRALAEYQTTCNKTPNWFYLEPGNWAFEEPGAFFQNALDSQEFDFKSFSNFSAPQIQEQADAYVISVPLEGDSQKPDINVEVKPHEIRLSGKVVHKNADSSLSTSSFFRSLTTVAELNTNSLIRKVKEKVLIITIPKKSESTNSQQLPQLRDGNFI